MAQMKLSPLHTAVDAGDLARVQVLVAAGADIEESDENDRSHTPLLRAARKGNITVARYLVERGANKEAEYRGGDTPLIIAAYKGYMEVVRMLIDHGANKDATGNLDWTPLINASVYGHVAVVEYLLEQGCDMDRASRNGRWTALHQAAYNGHFEMA